LHTQDTTTKSPAVDFINILPTHFSYKLFAKGKTELEKAAKKDFCLKKAHEKG